MAEKLSDYPICPECGEQSLAGYTPPKQPINYDKLGDDDYIDWNRAHLYCTSDRNCKFNTRFKDLTTPLPRQEQGSYLEDRQVRELRLLKQQKPAEYAKLVKAVVKLEGGDLYDGYHSFNDLYAHRNMLWMVVCSLIYLNSYQVWKMQGGQDKPERIGKNIWRKKVDDEWFLLGLYNEPGKQITYHLPMHLWSLCNEFANEVETAPDFDGHTSDDVLKRLGGLL